MLMYILWIKRMSYFTLVFIGFLFIFFDVIDTSPYYTLPYYKEARERLDQITLYPDNGQVFSGFSKVNITPDVKKQSVPLAGYTARNGNFAKGVHDSLFIKAVSIHVGQTTITMVSMDLLITPPEVYHSVMEWLKTLPNPPYLYFSATHTHAGLGGWDPSWIGEEFAGTYQKSLVDLFIRSTKQAITESLNQRNRSSIGSTTLSAPKFTRNRLNKVYGTINPDLHCTYIIPENEKPIILTAYQSHATVLSPKNFLLSGGYPGLLQLTLEQSLNVNALFFAGAVGSHSPAYIEGTHYPQAQELADSLSNKIIRALPQIKLKSTIKINALTFPLTLPDLQFRVHKYVKLTPFLGRKIISPEHSFFNMMMIDSTLWIGTPCDFSGELANEIKYFSSHRGYSSVVTSFNGNYIGYITPTRYYYDYQYESFVMGWYGPQMTDYLMDILRHSILKITQHPY